MILLVIMITYTIKCTVCRKEYRKTIFPCRLKLQKTCSTLCAKNYKLTDKGLRERVARMKRNNPMKNKQWKMKANETRKRMGYTIQKRGGNGQGMTVSQKILLVALGKGWYAEHIVDRKS